MKIKNLIFSVYMVLLLVLSISVLAIHGDPETPHGLEIIDLDIDIDYEPSTMYDVDNLDDTHSTVVNGDTINAQIYPGANVHFEFSVQNTFDKPDPDSNEDEVLIDGIHVEVIIEDINEGEDIDEDGDLSFDLEPTEDSGLLFVDLEIPRLVDSGSYNVLIELNGEGSNGMTYSENWQLTLDVTKPQHDIKFLNLVLEDNSLKCGATAKVTASIFNAGRQEESNVRIEILNDDLNLEESSETIELGSRVDPESEESDIEFEHIFEFEIPDDIDEDTYTIDATIYWNDIPFDTDEVELNVEQCELASTTTTTSTSTTTTTTVVDSPEDVEDPEVVDDGFDVLTGEGGEEVDLEANETVDEIFVSKEFSFTKSPLFLPLLIGLNLIFVIIIVGVFVLIRKPSESS